MIFIYALKNICCIVNSTFYVTCDDRSIFICGRAKYLYIVHALKKRNHSRITEKPFPYKSHTWEKLHCLHWWTNSRMWVSVGRNPPATSHWPPDPKLVPPQSSSSYKMKETFVNLKVFENLSDLFYSDHVKYQKICFMILKNKNI